MPKLPNFNPKLNPKQNKLIFRAIIGGIAFLLLFSGEALASQSGCKVDFKMIDWLIAILPSTPEDLKLANVLTKFAMEAPIGSAVIFEAYSGCFEILGIIAFFKGIRLLVDLKSLLIK